jgi:hypothetical protein
MNHSKRDLGDNVTKREVIIASIVVCFMLVTAILSYFYGHYKFLRLIAGGERLFRFWIVVILILLGIEGILRIIRRHREKKK